MTWTGGWEGPPRQSSLNPADPNPEDPPMADATHDPETGPMHPVRVGSMLYTLVDPEKGYEVAYNRWRWRR